MQLLVNIDVPDLERGLAFYRDGLGLVAARRLGPGCIELLGTGVAIYLLQNEEGSRATTTTGETRRYARHWCPVHLDFVVEDVEAAVARATAAGATLEVPAHDAPYGRIATLADPFGNGFCLLMFSGRGYDAIARSEG